MQVLGKKYLKSKLLKNYAENRNIDIYFDEDTLELSLHFCNLTPTQTEDDMIIYSFKEEQCELFFSSIYQVEGLEDLPHWIKDIKTLKELIKYMSKEGK